MRLRGWIVIAVAACLLGGAAAPVAAAPPPIKHVFLIVLENKNYSATFGNSSPAPYLSRTLTSQGQLLANYYAIGHVSLPNYIAMVSGQAPNPEAQTDCQFYTDFGPGTPAADGQVMGSGCVYPASVKTIADQLSSAGLTWKGYMEDMGNSTTEPKTCRHPAIGSQDHTQSAKVGDQYAGRHNPFIYFHSIIDNQSVCDANVVPLDRLPADLASVASTPNYSFITPNLCNDGHDAPCVDGKPGGLVSADAFLRLWVPRITGSPAYLKDGLLIVAFDEAEGGSSPSGDASACCNEQPGPNTPNPGGLTPGPGGGLTGAVLLSKYVRPGSINAIPYNHYSLLRSVEDVFGLGHLGYAGQAGLRPFGNDVYNASPQATCADTALPRPVRGRYRRGALIASARIRRSRRRALVLRVRHGSRVVVRVRRAGRRRYRRLLGPRRLGACRTYRFALPGRHGRVRVSAAAGAGHELRSLRYYGSFQRNKWSARGFSA